MSKTNTVMQRTGWVQQLLDWYDVNKRDLPWRGVGDPYKIWVSEVMSQQTRIEAMKPYYDNWMQLFPTVEALAAASEDEVVHAWQGLGYYSRARNLRLGVQEVVANYGGIVPKDRKSMESLKGVGAYTAGAVLSMAYNLPEVAVDGNVLRIYARLYNVTDDILSTVGKKKITALVEETLPHHRPGDFNQSLMDFGSSVCIPKSPRCGQCPISASCEAYANGIAADLPVRIKKTKSITIPLVVGLVQLGDYYLLHKRPNKGLLRSMWEFPFAEADDFFTGESQLMRTLGELGFELKLDSTVVRELAHVFSHRKWEMKAYRGTLRLTDRMMQSIENGYNTSPNQMTGDKQTKQMASPVCAVDEFWYDAEEIDYVQEQLPKDYVLLPRSEFANYTWAGPHGKLTELCK